MKYVTHYVFLFFVLTLFTLGPFMFAQQLAGTVAIVHSFTLQNDDKTNKSDYINNKVSLKLPFGGIGIFYKNTDTALESLSINIAVPEKVSKYAHNLTLFVYHKIPANIKEGDFYDLQSTLLFFTQLSQNTQTIVIPLEYTSESGSIKKKITKQTFIDQNNGIALIIQPSIKGFPLQIYDLSTEISVNPIQSSVAILAIRTVANVHLIQSDFKKIITLAIDGIPHSVLAQNIPIDGGSHTVSISGTSITNSISSHNFIIGKEIPIIITTKNLNTAILLLPKSLHKQYVIHVDKTTIKQTALLITAGTNTAKHLVTLTKHNQNRDTAQNITFDAISGKSYEINAHLEIIPIK